MTTIDQMRKSLASAAAALALAWPVAGSTQEQPVPRAEPVPQTEPVQPSEAEVQPSSPQPRGQPPAPSPVQVQQPNAPAPPPSYGAVPAGQWVFTAQNGWVWMPYGTSYVYQPSPGGTPLMYVYGPALGWSWVGAPWVVGVGPRPHFSVYVGPGRWGWGWRGGPGWRYGRPYHAPVRHWHGR